MIVGGLYFTFCILSGLRSKSWHNIDITHQHKIILITLDFKKFEYY